jgi:POT family proton-dependent oligopeptide transporter
MEIVKGETLVEETHPAHINTSDSDHGDSVDLLRPFPTEEEWETLPRVAGSIPWTAWTVAIVEFVERFSYYGTSAVCKLDHDNGNQTSLANHVSQS